MIVLFDLIFFLDHIGIIGFLSFCVIVEESCFVVMSIPSHLGLVTLFGRQDHLDCFAKDVLIVYLYCCHTSVVHTHELCQSVLVCQDVSSWSCMSNFTCLSLFHLRVSAFDGAVDRGGLGHAG